MKQGSAHLIPSCKPETQFGKGCGCTTDAFSSCTSILIGCIDPRLLCRSGKSPRAKKSSRKSSAHSLRTECMMACTSDSRSHVGAILYMEWIHGLITPGDCLLAA